MRKITSLWPLLSLPLSFTHTFSLILKRHTHTHTCPTWARGPLCSGLTDTRGHAGQGSATVPRCCGNPLKPLPGTAAAAADSCFSSFFLLPASPTAHIHPPLHWKAVYLSTYVSICLSFHRWTVVLPTHSDCKLSSSSSSSSPPRLSFSTTCVCLRGAAERTGGWTTDTTQRRDWLEPQQGKVSHVVAPPSAPTGYWLTSWCNVSVRGY